MSKRVVVFDVDGVLADFIYAFTTAGDRMFPGQYVVERSVDRKRWHGMSARTDQKIWDMIHEQPSWWKSLPAMVDDDTFERINRLCANDAVYFVTARHVSAKQPTEQWLREHGVKNPTVVLSDKKGDVCAAVGATHAIDDKIGNAVAISYIARKTRAYVLDREYNRVDHGIIGGSVARVETVDQFISHVE